MKGRVVSGIWAGTVTLFFILITYPLKWISLVTSGWMFYTGAIIFALIRAMRSLGAPFIAAWIVILGLAFITMNTTSGTETMLFSFLAGTILGVSWTIATIYSSPRV